MIKTEIAIVGGGPAGLAAAIEAASAGAQVIVLDENLRPGGQLFKQIHKFFGSKAHLAGVRGFDIGLRLLQQVEELQVQVLLDSAAYGLADEKTLAVMRNGRHEEVRAERIIIATGASENIIHFPGWTLPGVMGAGAAQTMINVNRVLPGQRVLMIGSGNVGLIVSYQLMQAGAQVVAIIEALPKIGGYGVHAAKIRRAGVPIFVSHTVQEVSGDGQVERATIVALDQKFQQQAGTEKTYEVDTVCLAVGLTPLVEAAYLKGCQFTHLPQLGGFVPLHDKNMETSVSGVYVAGDIAGVEEASTAMEEGRLAGVSAAESLGHLTPEQAEKLRAEIRLRLKNLRCGPFGEGRQEAKDTLLQRFQALV